MYQVDILMLMVTTTWKKTRRKYRTHGWKEWTGI